MCTYTRVQLQTRGWIRCPFEVRQNLGIGCGEDWIDFGCLFCDMRHKGFQYFFESASFQSIMVYELVHFCHLRNILKSY